MVTSKGVLASNEIASELRLFDVDETTQYLRGTRKDEPSSRVLATLSAVSNVPRTDAYPSLINGLRWSADSKYIYFKGEWGQSRSAVYRVGRADGAMKELTRRELDIIDYDVSGEGVVYRGSDIARSAAKIREMISGEKINEAATDITGMQLSFVLFPDAVNYFNFLDLGYVADGKDRVVAGTDAARFQGILNLSVDRRILSLSPDGRTVLELLPVEQVPDSWAGSYRWVI